MLQKGQIPMKLLYSVTLIIVGLAGFTLLEAHNGTYQWILGRKADLRATLARIGDRGASVSQDTAVRSRVTTDENKSPAATFSGYLATSDGVKIHYLEAGKEKSSGSGHLSSTTSPATTATRRIIALEERHNVPTILFVPGWTMPAWIWQKQIDYFSSDYRVVAMDPRSQGESSKPGKGVFPDTRAKDIKAVVDHLGLAPVVIVAWSLAVTELASYVDQFGTSSLAGVVIVDGTAGGIPPESYQEFLVSLDQTRTDPGEAREKFVRWMFHKPQSEEYIQRLTTASLATPPDFAFELLVVGLEADNRRALAKIDCPTLMVTQKSSSAALFQKMQKSIPGSRWEVFDDAGHALFVDDADRFNLLLKDFLARLR